MESLQGRSGSLGTVPGSEGRGGSTFPDCRLSPSEPVRRSRLMASTRSAPERQGEHRTTTGSVRPSQFSDLMAGNFESQQCRSGSLGTVPGSEGRVGSISQKRPSANPTLVGRSRLMASTRSAPERQGEPSTTRRGRRGDEQPRQLWSNNKATNLLANRRQGGWIHGEKGVKQKEIRKTREKEQQ